MVFFGNKRPNKPGRLSGLSKLSRLSLGFEYTLSFLMIPAFGLTVTLPWSIPAETSCLPGVPGSLFYKYLIILAVSGIMAILILWQARCILHIVNKGNPFIQEMVKRLRIIGLECLALAAVYLLSIFIITQFYAAVVFITSSVVGLLLFIVSQIFHQAIAYKEENDMTI